MADQSTYEALNRSMIECGIELRKYVLYNSIHMEEITSKSLSLLLGLDPNKSEVFGHTTKAIGFNQRVLLLMELGALEEKHHTKLQWFLQIRNQMMHNLSARTMTACLSYTSLKAKELLKAFPQPASENEEQQLVGAYVDLSFYVQKCAQDLIQTVERRAKQNVLRNNIRLEALRGELKAAGIDPATILD